MIHRDKERSVPTSLCDPGDSFEHSGSGDRSEKDLMDCLHFLSEKKTKSTSQKGVRAESISLEVQSMILELIAKNRIPPC
jgi:hypothetical protein